MEYVGGGDSGTMQNKIIILVGIIMLFILFMGTVSADASTSDLLPQPAEITPESNQSITLKKLTNETGSFQEGPCVIFADDHFYVAYQSNKTGNYDIFIRKYDSNWIDFTEEQITTNQSNQHIPSIVFADKYLYIAYVSNETGNLDIFVKKYNSALNPMGKEEQITKDESYQAFPSIAFMKDYLYIAYASNETGDYDIFVEKYDLNLTSVGGGKKQITFEENTQHVPSIIFADSCFYIAYYTFEDGIPPESEAVWSSPVSGYWSGILLHVDRIGLISLTAQSASFFPRAMLWTSYKIPQKAPTNTENQLLPVMTPASLRAK